MSCSPDSSSDTIEVRRCNLCRTEFEEGVADPGPGNAPRCPQCGLWDSQPIERSEDQQRIIRRTTRFR
ncbi:MAG TPA: hypothetical protein VM534_04855 [Thermoanaerobaculia bacterium]|nr:hypothetical protein [Thermoanaerobaculia bacterium]